MTDAISSYGITFARGNADGPPETFTTLAMVTNINPPAMTAAEHEVTDHTGSAGWQEWITSVLALESFTLEVNWDPDAATHVQLITDLQARTAHNYKITFPGSVASWTFAALVTGLQPGGADARGGGGVLTAEVTFRPSGSPTLA